MAHCAHAATAPRFSNDHNHQHQQHHPHHHRQDHRYYRDAPRHAQRQQRPRQRPTQHLHGGNQRSPTSAICLAPSCASHGCSATHLPGRTRVPSAVRATYIGATVTRWGSSGSFAYARVLEVSTVMHKFPGTTTSIPVDHWILSPQRGPNGNLFGDNFTIDWATLRKYAIVKRATASATAPSGRSQVAEFQCNANPHYNASNQHQPPYHVGFTTTTRSVTPPGAASRKYAVVSKIQPGSPAALANLACNVRILSVNGHNIDTSHTTANQPTQQVNDIILRSATKGAARIEFAALR
jgi:hypothetical protein